MEERDKLLTVMDEKVLSRYRKGSLAYVAARALCLAFCALLRNGETPLKWSDVDFTEGSESILFILKSGEILRMKMADRNIFMEVKPKPKSEKETELISCVTL